MDKKDETQIIKERIVEIQQMMEKMEQRIKKIQQYIFWSKIFSILRFLVLLGLPILLYIKLAPVVKHWIEPYQNLLNVQEEMRQNLNFRPNNLPKSLPLDENTQKLLEKYGQSK